MFCRYCGAHILEDSQFCARCGKRLVRSANPQIEKWIATFHLNTPYPYFGILIALGVAWALSGRKPTFDYTQTKWSIEMDRKLDLPDDHLYRESLSLVVENTGTKPLKGIPIEVHAQIDPQKAADVVAAFPGDREMVIQGGKPHPVVVVLADSIAAGAKRRYPLDASVQADLPFKVTVQVLKDDARTVLADHVLER